MNYSNQTLDGLINIDANTVYTDELYLNGKKMTKIDSKYVDHLNNLKKLVQ